MNNSPCCNNYNKILAINKGNEEAFEIMSEDSDFINDLKINSANLVDVILDIEDKYDIELDNDSMDKMLNVKAALEVINTKISEK